MSEFTFPQGMPLELNIYRYINQKYNKYKALYNVIYVI